MFFFQAEDGIRDIGVTGVQTCALPIFAQEQLGDVVYVELPKVGEAVHQGRVMGVIESVKAASDLFSPVTGEVIAVNEAAIGEPQKVNDSPYEEGWLIRVRPDNVSELDSLDRKST